MGKIIQIEVPDWVDEEEIIGIVKNYLEEKLPDSVTKEEFIRNSKINLEDIVEFSPENELKTLEELRRKAKERCQS